MTRIFKILPLVFALIMASCGHGDSIRVEGKIEGKETINLRLVYFSDGSVRTGVTASQEGDFAFEVPATAQSLVEIYDNDYRIMARFVADAGDDISLNINRQNPYLTKVKGNKLAEAWSKFLNDNAEQLRGASKAQRNKTIGDFVRANPDNPLSELLMATEFDASAEASAEAATLMDMIAPEAKSSGFSVGFAEMVAQTGKMGPEATVEPIDYKIHGEKKTYDPKEAEVSLIAFTNQSSGRDSIVGALRRLARHKAKGKFELMDLNTDVDTFAMRRTVLADSATWTQGWLPGGVAAKGADRLAIPSQPFFIVVGKDGRQLWRGASITAASSQVLTRLAE